MLRPEILLDHLIGYIRDGQPNNVLFILLDLGFKMLDEEELVYFMSLIGNPELPEYERINMIMRVQFQKDEEADEEDFNSLFE